MLIRQHMVLCYVMFSSRENGLDSKVTLVRGKVEEVDLPVEKV